MQWIDIACNLTHPCFQHDLPELLQRAKECGITDVIVPGSSVENSQLGLNLCEKYAELLHAMVGIHPHNAKTWSPQSHLEICSLAINPSVVAIGETGLDYFRDFSPRYQQRKSFLDHIEIASEMNLPLFTHVRDAHEDFYSILQKNRAKLSKVVVHCFTGDQKTLENYLNLDCHIGITGWLCDAQRGQHLLPLMRYIPRDRLMIETDAPYLFPQTLTLLLKTKNRRNEPCYLPHIAMEISKHKNITLEDLSRDIEKTTRAFFGL